MWSNGSCNKLPCLPKEREYHHSLPLHQYQLQHPCGHCFWQWPWFGLADPPHWEPIDSLQVDHVPLAIVILAKCPLVDNFVFKNCVCYAPTYWNPNTQAERQGAIMAFAPPEDVPLFAGSIKPLFVWPLTEKWFGMGDLPSTKSPARMLGLLGAVKPLHLGKVVVSRWNYMCQLSMQFDCSNFLLCVCL